MTTTFSTSTIPAESGNALHAPRTRPPVDYVAKLFTVADLAVLPSGLPSGAVRYELDNGRLITLPPPGYSHGDIQGNLTTALKMQGQYRSLGKAVCEVGVILWRNPDRVVGPDAVFIANASLPVRLSSEGYLETIPDLVVEVRSPNDTAPEVQCKVEDYLIAGVKVVWVADPGPRTVTEFRKDMSSLIYPEEDTLTAEEVIPGFQLPVRSGLRLDALAC
jgi:Uma2 family endonuclease